MSETLNTSNTRAVKKETFIAALLNTDGNISKACGQTNISRTTIYDWIKKDDSFQEKVINVSEELLDMAEDQLLKQIRDGNLTATIFYLKTKGQARGYIEKQYVHQTRLMGPDEVVLE
tara:strand:+ start:55 stop:408 length:354 start_codon:yes stop_codon:yes gene_type:complete